MVMFCSCVKVYEYIAARKPTVTTNVNGIYDLSKYVQTAHTASEFSNYIQAALNSTPPSAEIPLEFSWSAKAKAFLQYMECLHE